MEAVGVNKQFWAGKRVFLTGHTGFKGSWLSLWLQSLGADVTGYALEPNTTPNLFTLADVGAGMKSVIADIRDREKLLQQMKRVSPDIIIHMAAQPLVRLAYDEPVETYETNVMGTVHVLDAARHTSARAVLIVTSDKCYENRERADGYHEEEAMGGFDPYSSSKGCAELVTAAYRRSFFNPSKFSEHGVAIGSARAGNVIGGGDWSADRIVPDIVRAVTKREKVIIRRPDAVRPWQHVLDPISGYLRLVECLWEDGPRYSGGWNFGPRTEDEISVGELLTKIQTAWGPALRFQIIKSDDKHEAGLLRLDCRKAITQLRWEPRFILADAIGTTVEWYKSYLAGNKNLRNLTLEQIDRHEQCNAPANSNDGDRQRVVNV